MTPQQIIKILENPLSDVKECQKARAAAMLLDINMLNPEYRFRLLNLL